MSLSLVGPHFDPLGGVSEHADMLLEAMEEEAWVRGLGHYCGPAWLCTCCADTARGLADGSFVGLRSDNARRVQ